MALGWVALLLVAAASGSHSACIEETPTKVLICQLGDELPDSFNPCLCTHVVFPNQGFSKDVGRLKAQNPKLKVVFRQNEISAAPVSEGSDGVYLVLSQPPKKDSLPTDLKELAAKLDDISSAKRAKAKYDGATDDSDSDGLDLILELPSQPKLLAKHYDVKSLAKYVNYFVVPSDNLTDSSQDGLAYHPSRLMGIDDILNADSLVDLLHSMGAEHEKLIIALPAFALQFTLEDVKNNMPSSRVVSGPVKIAQNKLCKLISEGGWTLEREEDLTSPYAYHGNQWIAFDDSISTSIKGKYVLLRNLAGIAISSSEDDDWAHSCSGRPIVDTVHHTFTDVARKSRAAQLLSLQDQIHNSLLSYSGDVQLSPFRIVRVVDRSGAVHVVRKEAKTEFQCSRQGYFTHPSGCNRFYRCVKFNQYSSDFTVFEYDCPAGLAFDERYEVCVWPGSLPDASACKGSSEIAPVPRSRYACSQEGYFADPENCRWFFACLDHRRDGRSPPTAYEFRCPFGLVFDNDKLACDWPWKVPGCGSGLAAYATVGSGTLYPGDILEGRLRPAYAQVPDAHVSGGRIPNVEGGLVLGTSLLNGIASQGQGAGTYSPESSSTYHGNGYGSGSLGAAAYNSLDGSDGQYIEDNSGAYVHDPTGDTGGEYAHQEGGQVPYIHKDGAQVPYVHQTDSGNYKHQGESGAYQGAGANGGYSDGGVYQGLGSYSSGSAYAGQGDSGAYKYQGNGAYIQTSGAGSLDNTGYSTGSSSSGGLASGAYIHDSRGDTGGGYVHKEGAQVPYIHQEGGQSTYFHQTDNGENIHQGDGGLYAGSSYVQGGASLTSSVGAVPTRLSGAGAYVHDSRGDYLSGGAYVSDNSAYNRGSLLSTGLKTGPTGISSASYNIGSTYTNDVKTSGIDNGAYVGSYVSGLKSIGQASGSGGIHSGAYIHDSRGDSGGDYIHRDVPYTHQDGAQVPYIHQTDRGVYRHQGDGSYNYVGSQGYQHNSGAYVHDFAGDYGYYGGKYQVGQGAYHINTNLYQNTNQVYGSGAYVHDVRGDHDISHQSGYKAGPQTYGINLYQPVIHGVDSTKLHVESVGYTQPAVRVQPITVTSAPAVPLKPVQYIQPAVRPVVVTTPSPSLVGYQYKTPSPVQPVVVSSTPVTPLSPIRYNNIQKLQPVIHQAVQPVVVSTPAPPTVSYGYKLPAVSTLSLPQPTLHSVGISSTTANPLNTVHYVTSTSVPSVHVETEHLQPVQGYSYPKPVTRLETPTVVEKHVEQNVYVTTPATPTYINKQQFQPVASYNYRQPVQPFVSLSSIAPKQPQSQIYYTNSPSYVSTTVRPITVSSTPVIPLNPVQYNVNCANCAVSQTARPLTVTASPIKPVQPVYSYGFTQQQPICTSCAKSQTARPITVTSSPIIPLSPVQYSTPAPAVLGYNYPKPAVKFETPVSQQVYSYKQPVLQQTYTYKQPVASQPVFSYSYQKPIEPVVYSSPAPSYSTTVRPITVSSTPVIPLNPVQYIKPVQPLQVSTPAPPVIGYSYPQPAVKFETPVVQQTYTYKQPAFQQTYTYKQPVVSQPVFSYSYQKPIEPVVYSSPAPSYSTTVRPITVSSTPVIPLNPVQYVKPVQPLQVSTPAPPVIGYSYPKPAVKFETPVVQQTYTYRQPELQQTYTYKQPAGSQPIFSYSYQKPVEPVVYSSPAPSYSTTIRPITVSSTPVVPLNPVQYIKPVQVSSPAPPVVGYSYPQPAVKFETPVVQQTYSYRQPVVSTVKPITVSSTPVVSYNPVQYIKPVQPIAVSTPSPPVISYTYQKPILKTQPVQPVSYTPSVVQYQQPIRVTTPRPVVATYEQAIPTHPPSVVNYQPVTVTQTVRPFISVSTTPRIPLNPVQYVQPAQPKPIVNYSYVQQVPSVGYSYPKPTVRLETPVVASTPAPPVVKYEQQYVKQVVSTQAPPVINYSYQPVRTPTITPITVSSTPVVPYNPVQYVRPEPVKPIVNYNYVSQQPIPVSTPTPPVINYSYQPPKPVYVSTPAPPVVSYRPLASVTTPAPPVVNYNYYQPKTQTVRPYVTVTSTPAVPLNPVQYVAPIRVPEPVPAKPVYTYKYVKPQPFAIPSQSPEVVHYTTNEYREPIRPAITVTSTPAVPLAPVQYQTPAPPKPVFSYSYVKPTLPVVQETVTPFITQTTLKPAIKVSTTPAIPLAPVQYVQSEPQRPLYSYNYVRPTTSTIYETPIVQQTYKVTTPRPIEVHTTSEQPFVEYKPVRVRPVVQQQIYYKQEPVSFVQTTEQPLEYRPIRVRPAGIKKTPVFVTTTTEQPLGVSYYEEYFDSKKTEGYEYRKPAIQFKEGVSVDAGYQGEVVSSSFAPIVVPDIVSTTLPPRRRPVQTYVNTVEEENYYSSDVHDENLNVHLDIPRVGVQLVSTTTPEQIVEVTTVAPAIKRVRVKGGAVVQGGSSGGYYVRRQKVRVRPVTTTTENYPSFFTTTVKPIYSSTIDLTSPTLYSTTARPTTVYTTGRPTYSTTYRTTSTTDNELDVEDEEDDSRLIQEVSGEFGSVVSSGNSGIIKQGSSSTSTTTVSSLKDGEAIVGYVKKDREQFTGRKRTKVVVVSRLSDFNPLLVGKLGAECSCKSDAKTLDLTKTTRNRGKLFRPVTTTTVAEPSRDYLPTSTTPLPDDLTNNDYEDAQPPLLSRTVEIKPVRKTHRLYTTTGVPVDVDSIEYETSTRPARKISSGPSKTTSSGSRSRLDPEVDCQRPGLFRHPHICNKFYSCNWDEWKKRYTVSVFNCPIHLAFDSKLGACNWPSKGPACAENNLLV